MTAAGLYLIGVAVGVCGGVFCTSTLAAHYRRKANRYESLYRESVARESLHLMGPLALYGPLEPGVESTPIADALDLALWETEMDQ